MMSKIFVVYGSTGEWSDKRTWSVCAFCAENKAMEMVDALTRRLNTFGIAPKTYSIDYADNLKKHMNSLDKYFDHDYNGTRYWYEPVDFWFEEKNEHTS